MAQLILAGHCGADTGSLQRWVMSWGTQMQVLTAESIADCLRLCEQNPGAIVWANRIFDRTGESTLTWLESLQQEGSPLLPRVALITNFADVQRAATALGAMPGFGKAETRDASVANRVRQQVENLTRAPANGT